jgi:hypothetical protein
VLREQHRAMCEIVQCEQNEGFVQLRYVTTP